MASKAVHEYNPKSKIFVQIIDPEFEYHTWADWDYSMKNQTTKTGKKFNFKTKLLNKNNLFLEEF